MKKEISELSANISSHVKEVQADKLAVESSMVSNAFTAKSLGKLNVRLAALDKKMSAPLKLTLENVLTQAHGDVSMVAGRLLSNRSSCVFALLKDKPAKSLHDALMCRP